LTERLLNIMRNIKLRTKLLFIGTFLTLIPLLIVGVTTIVQNDRIMEISEQESKKLAYSDLDHIALSVTSLVKAQQEVLERHIRSSLAVAWEVVANMGEIHFAPEKVDWKAANQYTHDTLNVTLPRMFIGKKWLGQTTAPKKTVPIVDRVQALTGGATCTVFQRMNEKGDMLRVATNVIKKDGKRAIGTYIPAINPNGEPNPVVSTLLKGEIYNGRAYVVNAWYITAYEPIRDPSGKIVGALYVGIPQENTRSLRDAVMNIKVGKTGYVYVLDSQGHYVISNKGKRDGELIWNAKDDNGNLFIQEICTKALALSPGEIGEQMYPWKNPGDPTPRMKIARIAYFEPWDWIIGVGSYEEEFLESSRYIEKMNKKSQRFLLWVMIGALFAALIIWFLVARSITVPIIQVLKGIKEGAKDVAEASGQVSAFSQSLAEGASEQAATVEETSATLEEMTGSSRNMSEITKGAEALMFENIRKSAQTLKEQMALTVMMSQIEEDSDQIGQIIKTIDEIAFQTNLLALNAAVEAARAGEAGSGFAVVADEVRSLAIRAKEAARNTQDLLDLTIQRVGESTKSIKAMNKDFEGIIESATVMGEKTSKITLASKEQSDAIEQINKATEEINSVTQTVAADAEESASASEELSAQAETMNGYVVRLAAVLGEKSVS
jgi:methyl-accepting chemotaxis protein